MSVLTILMFLLDIGLGSVRIPARDVVSALIGNECDAATRAIVVNIRLVKALVALVAGAALSVSGLQMQTLFRNPLAGPYVLGISSGASLGVALFVLHWRESVAHGCGSVLRVPHGSAPWPYWRLWLWFLFASKI